MTRAKFDRQALIEESRARLLYILSRGANGADEHLRIELRFFIALKYGALRFSWFLLWRTLVAAWRKRRMLARHPNFDNAADADRILLQIERAPGLKFEEKT